MFRVATTVPDAARATVFVETPTDWYPKTPMLASAAGNSATFTVGADRLTTNTPLANAAFRVTVADAGQAIEQIVLLQ